MEPVFGTVLKQQLLLLDQLIIAHLEEFNYLVGYQETQLLLKFTDQVQVWNMRHLQRTLRAQELLESH